MNRFALAAALGAAACQTWPALASTAPAAMSEGVSALSVPLEAARIRGRMVVLADGLLIGRVSSARPQSADRLVVTVEMDDGAGFGFPDLTLTVPLPLETGLPIRLHLTRQGLRDILFDPAR